MAYKNTGYSSWAGLVSGFRLKLEQQVTSQNVSANTSRVRIRAWIQSRNNASFLMLSSLSGTFRGDTLVSTTKNVSCAGNQEVLIFDYYRTVTHLSDGNRTTSATANFSNGLSGSHKASSSLKIDRIPQLPDAPPAPKVTRSGGKITATSYTADGNGNSITDYQLRRRHNGSGSWSSWVTYMSKSWSFNYSQHNTTYQFQARAKTSRGWGPWSPTASIKTPVQAAPSSPQPPDSPDVETGAGSIAMSWGAAPVSGSTYRVALHNGSSWAAAVTTGTTRSYSWSGLASGTYMVRVSASNNGGWSDWEESEPFTVATLPSAPTVTLNDELTAEWAVPPDGGGAITGYDVQWWDGLAWSESVSQKTRTSEPPVLLPGIGYRCRVRARNAAGVGSFGSSGFHTSDACPCGD